MQHALFFYFSVFNFFLIDFFSYKSLFSLSLFLRPQLAALYTNTFMSVLFFSRLVILYNTNLSRATDCIADSTIDRSMASNDAVVLPPPFFTQLPQPFVPPSMQAPHRHPDRYFVMFSSIVVWMARGD